MSKSEKDHFSEYLKSPYFNPKAAKMLEDAFHLLRDIKDESWEKWDTRERVLRSLYPNEPEVATQDLMKRLRKLNTTLKKKLQVFLIHIAFKNTQIKDIEAVKGLLLLRILRERGLEEEFLREYWVQTKKWEAKKIKDWDDFQVKRDLLIEYYNYLAQDSRSNAAEILEIHRLQVDVAAQEYRIRILWLACLSMNQSLTLKGDDTLPDIASIMELLESNPPLLQANAYLHLLYYLCRMLMGVGGRADYAAFENLLAQHANDLSQKLYLGLVTLAISHCKRKILAGDSTYQKTANDLLYLQLDVFIQSGKKIPEKIFRNHVLVRARISEKSGDFSEVWKIFQQLKRNVTGKDETCFFRYIEGLLFFYEGKYWEAIERLDGIWNSLYDDYFRVDARCLYLLAYVFSGLPGNRLCSEAKNEEIKPEELQFELRNLQAFLNPERRKLPKSSLEKFQNYCKILKKYDKIYWRKQAFYMGGKVDRDKLSDLLKAVQKSRVTAYRRSLELLLLRTVAKLS